MPRPKRSLRCLAGLACWVTAAVAAAQQPAGAAAEATSAAAEPTKSLFDLFVDGGLLLWPILIASMVMLVVAIERLVSLRRGNVVPGPFIKCFLTQVREGESQDGALVLCEADNSHIGRVFEAGVRRWGKPAVEVEQAILDEGERSANRLRRNLRVINGVAQVCPLLGLLGTVVGMMKAFDQIAGAAAMGRPEALAGGISEALLSTAAGLGVAIPALILYLHFVGRVDSLVMEIDRRGQELVNLISAEALADRRGKRKAA
ncbi:Biopolymer transport protein ExbB [Posidoniimonas corsicana]|uniref:Biopolymer transport protein ExbB n=1 Tax=Posidoniimonas corsicana TaxID=1938618 RepID=A0A5C5VE89_9BACT|nr:MotA/TolQ/ExbB proton channel family protein [Posidoniimonas corsicana]TWT36229.1 Biopolymer transport protein ExbB [Posidoniimonas corsicana]